MLPTDKTARRGFTLIEMIIVMGLLGLISVVASGFLLVSMMASSKAQVTKEARQSGAYALSVMEGMILNSASVGCTPAENVINIKDFGGNLTTFQCLSGQIASNGAALTAGNVEVSNCVFDCTITPGLPGKVAINFTVSRAKGTRVDERASVVFSTQVITGNVQD